MFSRHMDHMNEIVSKRKPQIRIGPKRSGHVISILKTGIIIIFLMISDSCHIGDDRGQGLDLISIQIPDRFNFSLFFTASASICYIPDQKWEIETMFFIHFYHSSCDWQTEGNQRSVITKHQRMDTVRQELSFNRRRNKIVNWTDSLLITDGTPYSVIIFSTGL